MASGASFFVQNQTEKNSMSTDDFTIAIGDWVSWVATQLEDDALELLRVGLHSERVDLIVRMKAGVIALSVTNDAGQVVELFTGQVEPLKQAVIN
jgi:hypothetical protein